MSVQNRRSICEVAGHVITAQRAQAIEIVRADIDRDRTHLSSMGVEKCECCRQLGAVVGIVQRETGGRINAATLDECDACFAWASVIHES